MIGLGGYTSAAFDNLKTKINDNNDTISN